MSTSRYSRLFTLAALAAALTACGGGGGGDGDTSTPASASRPDAIEKYLGTIVLSCGEADEVVDDDTGAPLYVKETWTSLSKSSANKALFQNTVAFFDTQDCSGNARATHTRSGADTYIVVDGTATASGHEVDKITVSTGAIGGLSAGSNVVINHVRYPGNFFVTSSQDKDIARFDASGNLFAGDASEGPDGYPTALMTEPIGKKQ